MSILKFILIAFGLILAAMLAFSVVSFFYSALFYIFLLGVAAIGTTLGYHLLKKEGSPELKGSNSRINIEADDARTTRELEELKRKYLSR